MALDGAASGSGKEPRLAFVHADDVPWTEVLAQMHGDRRVSVRNKYLEWTDRRMVSLTRYDPGMVIERHGHVSDQVIYLLEGDLLVGDRPTPAGTLIVLEVGARFGPLVAGERGCLMLEVWFGDPRPVPADKEAHRALLRERGIEPVELHFDRPASAPPRKPSGGGS